MIDQYIQIHGKRLYGLCRTLCANALDADDLYQDTWLKVMKSILQYDTSQPFAPWLTRICVNTYRNALQRMIRNPIFNGFSTTEEKSSVLEGAAAPEAQDYSDLHQAIDNLPEKLRVTVILYYYQDMEIGAVAKTLGIPPGTVKSRLSKARQQLKEVLVNEANIRL